MTQREFASNPGAHSIRLDERHALSVTGVTEVERFDESSVVLATTDGMLIISGEGLNISRLSLETGELDVEGRVDRLTYAEAHPSAGFWSRLFR